MTTSMHILARNRALPLSVAAALAFAGAATTLRAETYEVIAGDDWSVLGPRLKPGDEVVLLEGTHVPAAFEGLAGEPGKPIVFRSKDPRALAQIKPDREGVKLVDCRHVRLERLGVRNARRAGIVIEGTEPGRSKDVSVHDVYVVGSSGLSEQAGIVVSRTDGFSIRRSRFENCAGSGVHLESVAGVSAETLQLRATPPARSEYGLQLIGDCRELEFSDLWIAGEFAVGISIGAKDAVERKPRERTVADVPPPASVRRDEDPARRQADPPTDAKPADGTRPEQEPRIRGAAISQCLIRGARSAIELGSCELVDIRNCSIIDPGGEVFLFVRPPKERPALRASFRENLVVWRPGGLSRFGAVVAGTEVSGLRLGPNLWWSEELPSALPLLGPEPDHFPGTIEVPQTIDIDPQLDPKGRVGRPEAKIYGRNIG